MSLPPKQRWHILRRDGFACVYCGARPPEAKLHVDHVWPVAHGGSDEESNLVAACEGCNLGKGAWCEEHPTTGEEYAAQIVAILTRRGQSGAIKGWDGEPRDCLHAEIAQGIALGIQVARLRLAAMFCGSRATWFVSFNNELCSLAPPRRRRRT